WFSGAAETALRDPGSCDVVVCAGQVSVRGVEPASPGRLRGGMSPDPAGRHHIQYERGSGRGTLGSTTNAARPGNLLRASASPCDTNLRALSVDTLRAPQPLTPRSSPRASARPPRSRHPRGP